MNLMRLLLLFLLGLMLRRLLQPLWRKGKKRQQSPAPPGGNAAKPDSEGNYADLTEQGIDDADFEEIP